MKTGRLPATILAGALLLSALLYAPTLTQGWKEWDDPKLVLRNPRVQGLTPRSLAAILRPSSERGEAVAWQPVRDLSYAIDWACFRDHAFAYHLENVAWGLAGVALAFLLARRFLEPAGAAVSAAVFALHPVRVESVAWISGRKDLLAAVFFLGACALYLRAVGSDRVRRLPYAASLLLALLAFLSKPTALQLPAVLCLLEWLRSGRATVRRLLPTVPFWALAAITAIGIASAGTAAGIVKRVPLLSSLAAVPPTLLRYAGMLVLPVDLAAAYDDRRPLVPWDPSSWLALLALLALASLLLSYGPLRRWSAFSLAWILVLLSPTLGAIPLSTLRADRYLHLPLFGFAVLAGAAWELRARWVRGAIVLFLAACAALTGVRVRAWSSDIALWEDAVRKSPRSTVAYTSLGRAYEAAGRARDAERAYKEAVRIAPGNEIAWLNLGAIYLRSGDLDLAENGFRKSLEARPGYLPARLDLAGVLLRRGDAAGASTLYEEAATASPRDPDIWYHVGLARAAAGRLEEALVAYDTALRLAPAHRPSRVNRIAVLRGLGRAKEASQAAAEAANDDPGDWRLRALAGDTAYDAGDPEGARREWSEALRLAPGGPEAEAIRRRLRNP